MNTKNEHQTTNSEKSFDVSLVLFPDGVLDDNREIDLSNWKDHEEQLSALFSLYRERVNPLISVYNSLENRFPVGVINELRDIFSHLTLSLLADDNLEVDRHLDKAHRHLKRAVVDAFKYASMACSKYYDDFRESYKCVDLSYVDNGQFLPKVARLNATAEQLMHKGKMIESEKHSDDEMYDAYEEAFNCYAELYFCIKSSTEAVETIKLKTIQDENARKKEHRIDRTIGIIGMIVGVVGMIFGVLGVLI